jgi:hypothetical protein
MSASAVIFGSLQLTSGWGAFLSIVVLGGLFLIWLVTLFVIVTDSISVLAKIVWLILVTCLAPIAIPVYLILHHRRVVRA